AAQTTRTTASIRPMLRTLGQRPPPLDGVDGAEEPCSRRPPVTGCHSAMEPPSIGERRDFCMTMNPGWHPDPTGRFDIRYWDGTLWTEHVGRAGVQTVDPLPPAIPASA